jgi:hypothetical protein
MSRYDEEQETIEADQRQAHADGICEGIPLCGYCLDDWEEQNREEFDRAGYYDSKGHWVK